MVMPRSRSRSFESMTRSWMCSCAAKVPDCCSSLSTSVVLPWLAWVMMATLRRARGMGAESERVAHCTRGISQNPTSIPPRNQPPYLPMDKELLSKTAAAMVAKGKGILAADESSGSCEKRFKSVGVECTEENRRAYRGLLFGTPGVEQSVSGVILFDERARQEASIVPMIEPEVLLDGDHTAERSEEVHEATLRATYAALAAYNVSVEHLILKTSMVVSGKDCPRQAGVDEVAERTVRVLKRTVPAAQPGIVFLSGGQSDEAATAHLNAMAAMKGLPWPLTFSYSRALQNQALKTWRGQAGNVGAAQKAFFHRAHMNGLAAQGKWRAELEK